MNHVIDTATMTVPFLCVIILYCLILTGLGWYGSQKNKGLSDYFTMSGKAGAILTGIAYFSTQYSMSTFMGVPRVDLPRRLRGDVRLGAWHRVFDAHSGTSRRPSTHHARSPLQHAHDGRLPGRPL